MRAGGFGREGTVIEYSGCCACNSRIFCYEKLLKFDFAVLHCLDASKTWIGKQLPAGVAHSLNYGKLRKMNLAVLRCLNINKTCGRWLFQKGLFVQLILKKF